jgi:hypothetical protein
MTGQPLEAKLTRLPCSVDRTEIGAVSAPRSLPTNDIRHGRGLDH